MHVPFLNLKAINDRDADAFLGAMRDLIASGHYINGQKLSNFEAEYAAYSQAKHCIGVGNGLDALVLILRAAGIGVGDEVIVPANTFIASFLAISAVGASPVPVDVDSDTLLISAVSIEAAITESTKAVMPVHLFGHVCDMQGIRRVTDHHHLYLIEDAAQAHGAKDADGHVVGSTSFAAGFSFYPGKNLGALGDGGAIVTQDDALAEELRALRNYGAKVKYVHDSKGTNSRLDELQAAILSIRLKHLEDDNIQRRRIADFYLREISNPSIRLPRFVAGTESVWHLFVARVQNRDAFIQYLEAKSVQTLIHYPIPCHKQHCYPELQDIDCPVSEVAANEVVSLPISPVLTVPQVEYVVETLNAWKG